MAPPMFTKRVEGWQINNPEMVAIHEKHLEEIGKLFTPLPPSLPVQQDIRHLSPLEQENLNLKQKNAELSNELDDAHAMLELASTKYLRVKLDVKKLRGTLDFVNGHEFVYASINQDTNMLERVDTKP